MQEVVRTAPKLRLSCARRQVRAFLNQLEALTAGEFPQEEGHIALLQLQTYYRELYNEGQAIPDVADPDVIKAWVAKIDENMPPSMRILGFILRSTNTRNAFEVYYPLKNLIRMVLNREVKLLVSSEWDFVPFTFPLNLKLLPNFVFIGSPAQESANVLLTPLAGHEIGHSAWKMHGVAAKFGPKLNASITDRSQSTDVDSSTFEYRSGLANLQAQEIFCDLFGLFIFREAYLYAFAYFLSSSLLVRDSEHPAIYPAPSDRLDYLMRGAERLKLRIPSEVAGAFEGSFPARDDDEDTLIVDESVRSIFDDLTDETFGLLERLKVPLPREKVISHVLAALGRHEPFDGNAYLSEIVLAGWAYLLGRGGLSSEAENAEYDLLIELLLKSVEVSEFKRRVNHAKRQRDISARREDGR